MARTKFLQQVFWDNDHKMPKAATVPSREDLAIAWEEERESQKAQRRKKVQQRHFARKVLEPHLHDIFQLEFAGYEVAEIAEILGLAQSTVETYRSLYRAKIRDAKAKEQTFKQSGKRKP